MNEMINKSIDVTMFDKDTTNATTSRDRGYITASAGLNETFGFGNSSGRNTKMQQFALALNSSRTNHKNDIDSTEVLVMDEIP